MKTIDVKVTVKTRNDVCKIPVSEFTVEEVVNRIEKLNEQLASFWSEADGWAPIEAAGLLGKSRLDWQVSLSGSLRLWIGKPADSITPAELILGWTNLGSLIEGTIKLFLSAYYHVYVADIDSIKKANAFDHKKDKIKSPDGLMLESLRQYCKVRSILDETDLALVALVQKRRNAIHAFQDKNIGDADEFCQSVRGYLQLLRNLIARLPYPGDEYVPFE